MSINFLRNNFYFLLGLLLTSQTAFPQEAFYMANEAVMVTDGETKVLFDPLYPETYGQYLLVPDAMREARTERCLLAPLTAQAHPLERNDRHESGL